MVLVDTSVWVEHLRAGGTGLEALLDSGEVACHPFVVGELSCGHLTNRAEVLSLLRALPMAEALEHEEALRFIDSRRLMGKGLGYVDVHLLASAVLAGVPLWTLDRRLSEASSRLGLRY
jgi:hypothetical protein